MRLLLFGAVLVVASWLIAWSRIPILTEYSFFPLWLGYVVTINGVSEVLYGDSLLRRMRFSFLWLFAISIPMWWCFEYLNSVVQNWHYVLPHPISQLHYNIQASVDFSTVVPAVLSAAFLFSCLFKNQNLKRDAVRIQASWFIVSVLLSIAFFFLVKLFPREAFPLIWIAPLFLLEPILYFFSSSSLLRLVEKGEWLLPVSLMIGTLFTGFWWEFWNFYSMPKWIYTIPYVDFWRIFEMPLLGYGGYPFFGLIAYSYGALVFFFIFRKEISRFFD